MREVKHVLCVQTRTIIKMFTPQEFVEFQASAAKQIRSAVFWVISQRIVVIPYICFGPTYRMRLQGENDSLARNVCKELLLCSA
jgi:hypothetical protein